MSAGKIHFLICAVCAQAAFAPGAELSKPSPPAGKIPPGGMPALPGDKSDWWSFKPATRPPLPTVKNKKWAKNPIDLFISAKLEERKLLPAPEADRRTLIRRLSFDLTGLPPTPE